MSTCCMIATLQVFNFSTLCIKIYNWPSHETLPGNFLYWTFSRSKLVGKKNHIDGLPNEMEITNPTAVNSQNPP